jgi:hypothetical protein
LLPSIADLASVKRRVPELFDPALREEGGVKIEEGGGGVEMEESWAATTTG